MPVALRFARVGSVSDQLALGVRDRAEHGARRIALLVDLELFQHLLDQVDLVVVVVDREARIAAEVLDVAPQPAGALAWNVPTARPRAMSVPTRPSRRSRSSRAALLVNVTASTFDGALSTRFEQVRDAMDDDARLARARPGQDQQRPVDMRDRLALMRIQARRSFVGAVGGWGGHVADVLTPWTGVSADGVRRPLRRLGDLDTDREALAQVLQVGDDQDLLELGLDGLDRFDDAVAALLVLRAEALVDDQRSAIACRRGGPAGATARCGSRSSTRNPSPPLNIS